MRARMFYKTLKTQLIYKDTKLLTLLCQMQNIIYCTTLGKILADKAFIQF
jgi:hypothetical protein